MKSTVAPICWYLVVGVSLNSLLVSIVLRFAHCAVDERIAREQLKGGAAARRRNRDNMTTDQTNNTIAKAIFRLPINGMVFSASGVDVEEEPQEAWTTWF